MKILFLSNNSVYDYEKMPRGWSVLPHLFEEQGHEVLALKKNEMLNFYKHYKAFKPDVVVSTWIPAGTIPALYNMLGKIKVPVVHSWDDYYQECMTGHNPWITGFLERFTIKYSDVITTVLMDNYRASLDKGKETYMTLMGTDNRKDKCLYRLISDKNKLKVLHIGEQTRYKQVDKLIKQLANHPHCDLFLVGTPNDGFAKWVIANEIKNISFYNPLPSEQIYNLCKQADVCVSSGNQDGNFKLFEYIRAGKPIVAWDGRPNNLFKNGENALLTRDFGKAITQLYKDRKLRKKLSANVKKIKLHTWTEVAKDYLRVLNEIVEKGK